MKIYVLTETYSPGSQEILSNEFFTSMEDAKDESQRLCAKWSDSYSVKIYSAELEEVTA